MTEWYLDSCAIIDNNMLAQARSRQLQLTKPPGSLGRIEQIAVDLAAQQGRLDARVDKVEIAVFAGDHGVANDGVSAFPQAVTGEMVKNFVRGGAAISVLARQIGAGLTVVNAGTINQQPFGAPVVDHPVAYGTGNIKLEAAMSSEQCIEALALGRLIAEGFSDDTELVIGGEMGIANTTSATALGAAFGIASAADLVGPGTGLDRQGQGHKLSVIEQSLARLSATGITPENNNNTLAIMTELGGFEIVALCGYYLRAAQLGYTILVDGFISTTAAVAACRINPGCRDWMLFSHNSAEPGHKLLLDSLAAKPLLNLEMRLGEGSGAAIAVSLLRSACHLQNEMATFAEAGVSDG